MSLTLPIMYFKTGSDLSQITHFEVNYPDDFVKQAWERPEINLFIVCVATKKGAVREIKGGMAVLTSIPASNGLELSGLLMTFLENLMNSARSQVRRITCSFRQRLVLRVTPHRTRVA